MSFVGLPAELVEEIASYIINRKDLLSLRLVSKRHHEIVTPLLWRDYVVRVQYSLLSRLHDSVLTSSSLARRITKLEFRRDPWPRPGAAFQKPSVGRRISVFFPKLGAIYERFQSWRRDKIRSSNLRRVLPSLPQLHSMYIPSLEDLGDICLDTNRRCPQFLLSVQELHLTAVWGVTFSQVFWCMVQMPHLRTLNVHRISYSATPLPLVKSDFPSKMTRLTLRLSTMTELSANNLLTVLRIPKKLQSLTLINDGLGSTLTLSGILKALSTSQRTLTEFHLSRAPTISIWDDDETGTLFSSFTALSKLHLPYSCLLRASTEVPSLDGILPENLQRLRLGDFASTGSIEQGISLLQRVMQHSPTLEMVQLQILLPRQNLAERIQKESVNVHAQSIEPLFGKAWFIVLSLLGRVAGVHTNELVGLQW